ncbi:unnamed protein product, partial [Closterium sp. NIES-65]
GVGAHMTDAAGEGQGAVWSCHVNRVEPRRPALKIRPSFPLSLFVAYPRASFPLSLFVAYPRASFPLSLFVAYPRASFPLSLFVAYPRASFPLSLFVAYPRASFPLSLFVAYPRASFPLSLFVAYPRASFPLSLFVAYPRASFPLSLFVAYPRASFPLSLFVAYPRASFPLSLFVAYPRASFPLSLFVAYPRASFPLSLFVAYPRASFPLSLFVAYPRASFPLSLFVAYPRASFPLSLFVAYPRASFPLSLFVAYPRASFPACTCPPWQEVWERTRLKQQGKAKAPCGVSAEWSPDGRHILVATTAPRLQVDNGFKVFKYDSSLLLHRPYGLLYQAEWAPAPEGTYADRPPSPRSAKKDQASPVQPPATKPAPYRPPNAALMTSTFRAQMSGEDDKPHRIGAPKKYIPPGAESAELSKSAKKNAKKREAAKAKKDAASPDQVRFQASHGKQASQQAPNVAALSIDDGAKTQPEQQASQGAGGGPDEAAEKAKRVRNLGKRLRQVTVLIALHSSPFPSRAGQGSGADEAAEKAKRVRNLGKRLRQIEELKAWVAAAGGSTVGLDAAQLEKLGQEAAVRAELASLQG